MSIYSVFLTELFGDEKKTSLYFTTHTERIKLTLSYSYLVDSLVFAYVS